MAIVGGTVFLIFSVNSLLAYRKATAFHMLILYPATSLNLSVLKVCTIFYVQNNIICKQDLISSFSICMPLISFSYLIVLARISSIMGVVSGHSFLLILEEILSVFPLSLSIYSLHYVEV